MKVRDIMTQPPQTCHVYTDLATASRRMKESGTGMLVVLGVHGRVEGVVTDRDLAMAISHPRHDLCRLPIARVMTPRVHTCREEDDVHAALAQMATTRVRRLPVVGDDGDLRAVLSVDDIILWAVQQGGISPKELASALRNICSPHMVPFESEVAPF